MREYDLVIQGQLRDGMIEAVSDLEVPEIGRSHYLSHHAVVRRDATTTKLRVVYDVSSRVDGKGPS